MRNDPEYSVINGEAVLLERYSFEVCDCILEVPIVFRWNGSNIPRWLQWLFGTPFDNAHAVPSLEHDRLYEIGYLHVITRREADAKYRRDIINRGQPRLLAWLEWANIRIFGRKYWKDF